MEEVPLVGHIAGWASRAFRTDVKSAETNFKRLCSLVERVTPPHLNMPVGPSDGDEPVSHIGICECPQFTIGVFIIQSGRSIPLHDHPGMTGIIKVLYGTINIRSYDPCKQNDIKYPPSSISLDHLPLRVYKNDDVTATPESGCQTITVDSGCYHAIDAVGGDAAFLDILSPSYIGVDCTYYKEWHPNETTDHPNETTDHPNDTTDHPNDTTDNSATNGSDTGKVNDDGQSADVNGDNREMSWLIKTLHPPDFYTDSIRYTGYPVEHLM